MSRKDVFGPPVKTPENQVAFDNMQGYIATNGPIYRQKSDLAEIHGALTSSLNLEVFDSAGLVTVVEDSESPTGDLAVVTKRNFTNYERQRFSAHYRAGYTMALLRALQAEYNNPTENDLLTPYGYYDPTGIDATGITVSLIVDTAPLLYDQLLKDKIRVKKLTKSAIGLLGYYCLDLFKEQQKNM